MENELRLKGVLSSLDNGETWSIIRVYYLSKNGKFIDFNEFEYKTVKIEGGVKIKWQKK